MSTMLWLTSWGSWLYWGLALVYCVTILSVVAVVLSENRNPVKSLAWVTVLILFPVGGLVLYIFFGRSLKHTRMISRRKQRRLQRGEHPASPTELPEHTGAESRQHMRLARRLTGAAVTEGNRVEVHTSGEEMFAALLADIRVATRYIHLQYYIIEDDETGRRLGDLLAAKAAEGVQVRVIYDDIGSMHLSRSFLKRMRAAGVEMYPFARVVFPPFAARINWRNHRKVGVIDGRVGYIGGMNIANRYMDGGKRFTHWRDTHLRVRGPAVGALQYSFAVDWNYMGRRLLDEHGPLPADMEAPGNDRVQMVTSGPTSRWSNIALMMLKAIGNAKQRIYLQTPYFLPTESLLRALQAAALSGIDVRVMMPERSDSTTLTYASRSYVMECLRAGVKIYLYREGMLHAKTMVIDEEFASVGSTNFDFRSFEHNFEGNMFVYSRTVNRRLARDFIADQRQCVRLHPAQWRHRSLREKALESVTRLLAPIL